MKFQKTRFSAINRGLRMVLSPRNRITGFFKPENRLFAGWNNRIPAFCRPWNAFFSRREDFLLFSHCNNPRIPVFLALSRYQTTFYMRDSYYFHRVFTRFHDFGFGGFQLRNSSVTGYSFATDCDGSIWNSLRLLDSGVESWNWDGYLKCFEN